MPSIGASLFMIAVGAILKYAVSDSVSGISLPTIGLILMIVGIVGLVLSLIYFFSHDRRRDTVVERDRYVDPPARY